MLNRDYTGIGVVLLTTAIFGLYPTATRAVYQEGANAYFIILFTTFWRTLGLTAFCYATGNGLFQNATAVSSALWNGVCQTLTIVGILGAMVYLPGPVVIIIVFSHTLLLYLFGVFKQDHDGLFSTLLAVIAALFGLSFVVQLYDATQTIHLGGLALAVMASVTTALRLYAYGQLVKDRSPATVGAEAFIVALILIAMGSVQFDPVLPDTQVGWLWASLAALSLSLGTFGIFYGIRILGAFKFSFFANLEPVFTMTFAALLIQEILSGQQYFGMALIIGSLAVYQYREQMK